jgi:hypothetical protein
MMGMRRAKMLLWKSRDNGEREWERGNGRGSEEGIGRGPEREI